MKTKLITLLLSGLALSMAAASEPLTLRVMTFNIHHGEGIDGRLDLERIARVITDARADLVGLQEVDRGVERTQRRAQLDDLAKLNHQRADELGDPETLARIDAYEMAFRMQSSVPELADLSDEKPETLEMYGVGEQPTDNFARQCLLARRFAEKGVRFIEVSHGGWDTHRNLRDEMAKQCGEIDKPIAALLADLH